MEYDKKKELSPLETVEKARNILADLDVLTVESWKHPFDQTRAEPHSFSVRVDAPQYGFGTNGKGTSRSYALASAYGEFMERLQNLILLPVEKMTRESLQQYGFLYFPDERICSVQEVQQADDLFSRTVFRDFYRDIDMAGLLEGDTAARSRVISAYQETELGRLDERLVTWPFYSVRTNQTVYLWNRFVTFLHGSNGMCAGNTPQEALVQGLSEIFERYASAQVLANEVVPPDIPAAEYNVYGTITSIIREIEQMGPFSVLVKDCSLGQGLPVCAVVLIDREKQRYCANFGCHPHLPVAIERCLTELLQGYDPASRAQNDSHLLPFDANETCGFDAYLNVRNMHCNGRGIFSPAFFGGTPSYKHCPFEDMSGADNHAMLRHCMDIALRIAGDVFIRDVSYLGFPACFILAPGISHYPTTQKLVRLDSAYASLADPAQYRTDITEGKLKRLLVGLRRWECSSAKSTLSFHPGKLKAAALMMLRCYDDLQAHLERQARCSEDPEEAAEFRALLHTIKLMASGYSMDNIQNLITLFHSPAQWKTIQDRWLCRNPVGSLLDGLPAQEALSPMELASNALFCRMKAKFREKTIVQQDLQALFSH